MALFYIFLLGCTRHSARNTAASSCSPPLCQIVVRCGAQPWPVALRCTLLDPRSKTAPWCFCRDGPMFMFTGRRDHRSAGRRVRPPRGLATLLQATLFRGDTLPARRGRCERRRQDDTAPAAHGTAHARQRRSEPPVRSLAPLLLCSLPHPTALLPNLPAADIARIHSGHFTSMISAR